MSAASDNASALVLRLEAVSISNGFFTNAGANVFHGALKIPADKVPALVLQEGEEDVLEQKDDMVCRVRVPYTIEGHIVCDPLNPNIEAHRLIADVQRAIFANGLRLADGVSSLKYAGRTINPREDGSKIVTVQVKLQAEYRLDLSSP